MRYRMTDAQLERLLEACKPVRYMVMGGMPPRSPQENANAAWAALGAELKFDPMSVQDARAGDMRDFSATPVATELVTP